MGKLRYIGLYMYMMYSKYDTEEPSPSRHQCIAAELLSQVMLIGMQVRRRCRRIRDLLVTERLLLYTSSLSPTNVDDLSSVP